MGTGPDVAWIDERSGASLGIELKTDKENGSSYFKKEVAQSQNHNSWLDANEKGALGTVIIGPLTSVSADANPDERIFHAESAALVSLRDKYLDNLEKVRAGRSDERASIAADTFGVGWGLPEIHAEVLGRRLSELPQKG